MWSHTTGCACGLPTERRGSRARRDAGVVCVRRGGRRGEHSRRVSVLRARRSALESRVGSPGARAMPSGSAVSMCTNHHGRRRGRRVAVGTHSRLGDSPRDSLRSHLSVGSRLFVPHMSPPPRAHAIAIILHRVRVTSMTAERPDMLRHRETRRAHFIRFQSTCHSRRISASDFGGVP